MLGNKERVKQKKLQQIEELNSFLESEKSGEEFLPLELVEEMVMGSESKVKLMRCYRGYSLAELAKKLSIPEFHLMEIEAKEVECDFDLYVKLGKILDIDVELLLEI